MKYTRVWMRMLNTYTLLRFKLSIPCSIVCWSCQLWCNDFTLCYNVLPISILWMIMQPWLRTIRENNEFCMHNFNTICSPGKFVELISIQFQYNLLTWQICGTNPGSSCSEYQWIINQQHIQLTLYYRLRNFHRLNADPIQNFLSHSMFLIMKISQFI